MKKTKNAAINQKMKEKMLTVIFLGLTLGSTAFLGYTTFLWISIERFYFNLENDLNINQVKITTSNGNRLMNVTITIRNELACSHVNIYIAIEQIIVNGNRISLIDYYRGPLPGTFTRIKIPQLTNASVKLIFTIPESFPRIENQTELNFVMKIIASTILNEDQPQTIRVIKSARLII